MPLLFRLSRTATLWKLRVEAKDRMPAPEAAVPTGQGEQAEQGARELAAPQLQLHITGITLDAQSACALDCCGTTGSRA